MKSKAILYLSILSIGLATGCQTTQPTSTTSKNASTPTPTNAASIPTKKCTPAPTLAHGQARCIEDNIRSMKKMGEVGSKYKKDNDCKTSHLNLCPNAVRVRNFTYPVRSDAPNVMIYNAENGQKSTVCEYPNNNKGIKLMNHDYSCVQIGDNFTLVGDMAKLLGAMGYPGN